MLFHYKNDNLKIISEILGLYILWFDIVEMANWKLRVGFWICTRGDLKIMLGIWVDWWW
jgi:hypothetical protein